MLAYLVPSGPRRERSVRRKNPPQSPFGKGGSAKRRRISASGVFSSKGEVQNDALPDPDVGRSGQADLQKSHNRSEAQVVVLGVDIGAEDKVNQAVFGPGFRRGILIPGALLTGVQQGFVD